MRISANVVLVLSGSLSVPAALSAQASVMMPTHINIATPDSAGMRSLLTGPLGSRGPSGSAVLSGHTLRIEWTGDQPGTARPWSVRRGSCTRDEGAVGTSTSLPLLTVDAGGNARASTVLQAPLPGRSTYYVVVRSSEADAEPSALACGSLSNGVKIGSTAGAMDHAAKNHSTVDHAGMNMETAKADGGCDTVGAPGMDIASTRQDGMSSRLTAIHRRMMADPVIRERVLTDPVLQRLIGDLNADSAKLSMTGTTIDPKTPTARLTAKKTAASKPTAKPVPKPAAPAMPGMDHSMMLGMKKPPV